MKRELVSEQKKRLAQKTKILKLNCVYKEQAFKQIKYKLKQKKLTFGSRFSNTYWLFSQLFMFSIFLYRRPINHRVNPAANRW
jgi:hypothetical protein